MLSATVKPGREAQDEYPGPASMPLLTASSSW